MRYSVLSVVAGLTVGVPRLGAQLVFASEFAQLSVNAIYMGQPKQVEQATTPPRLRGRVQGSRIVSHAVAGTAGFVFGGMPCEWFGTSAPILIRVLRGVTSFVWLLQLPIYELVHVPLQQTRRP
jgi:hypothetical protein